MAKSSRPAVFHSALCACGFALLFLLLAVLPVALYQYFSISTPEFLAGLSSAAWTAYLAPLTLLPSFPVFRSNDPLVSLVPSFALMFCFWASILLVLLLLFRRRGRES